MCTWKKYTKNKIKSHPNEIVCDSNGKMCENGDVRICNTRLQYLKFRMNIVGRLQCDIYHIYICWMESCVNENASSRAICEHTGHYMWYMLRPSDRYIATRQIIHIHSEYTASAALRMCLLNCLLFNFILYSVHKKFRFVFLRVSMRFYVRAYEIYSPANNEGNDRFIYIQPDI